MNALAEYGTSSSSNSENEEVLQCEEETKSSMSTSKFPKPELGRGQTLVGNSVFVNPFVQAELAKSAILEKHVKMVPVKDQQDMINGKRICWNYRKGRCRFGHNCKYAHDSDVQRSDRQPQPDPQSWSPVTCEVGGAGDVQSQADASDTTNASDTTEDVWEGESRLKLKRPGLSKGIVPSKRVLKMYQQQKSNSAKK